MTINDLCELTLRNLYKFSKSLLYTGDSIDDNRIENFEQQIGYILPLDYKYIIKKHNGITLAGTEIYGLSNELRDNSVDKIYGFEHFEVDNPMPDIFLPFSPDGQGNHYCLDLSNLKDNLCPVVFWQWDIEYDSIADVEVCNTNLLSGSMK
jgi:cell wall assembly regulator SMI1